MSEEGLQKERHNVMTPMSHEAYRKDMFVEALKK